MTQKEIDEKLYEYNSFVTDKFRDIQAQANTLKYVDRQKNEVVFAKISDFIADIRHVYDKIEELERETPDAEEEENNGMSFFSSGRNRMRRP